MPPSLTSTSGLYSIAKIAILTFFGAFFGALTLSGSLPSTWLDAKALLMPALGVAVACEVYYLRTLIAQMLKAAVGAGPAVAMHVEADVSSKTASVPVPRGFAAYEMVTGLVMAGALVALSVLACGCLSSAPTVPQTPDNAAQISSCESTAALHDGVMIGDFVVGGTGAALAGVAAAVSDPGQKTALAVGAAIAGGIGLAGTAVAGFSASNFANSHCSDVVGALPVSPFGKQHDAGAP